MAGTLTFTPTERDYAAASRAVLLQSLLSLRGSAMRWIVPVCVIAAGFFLTAGPGPKILPWIGTAIGAVVVLGIQAINFALIPGSVRRMIARRPSLTREIRFAWSDHGIEASSATGVSRLDWTQLRGWSQGRHGFVLLSGRKGMLIVPAHALDPARAADLRATLTQHMPNRC